MMHSICRLTLAVSLSMFVFSPTIPAFAQDIDVAAEKEHADGDHKALEEGDDAEHEHALSDAPAGHVGGEHAVEHADMPPLLSFDIGSAVCNLAIFLGVLAILSKFVWPAILGGLKAREEKINADLDGAQKANLEAKGLLTEYQSKLDDAASQVQAMLAEARRDAEASGQRIVDEAKAEAQRQSDRALADIETAKKVAISEIAGQTSDMAINVAKQVVGRELQAGDHAELIRQSLERLPSNN